MTITRWQCRECYWVGPESSFLVASNPFTPGEQIVACPNCREINSFEPMCDVDGCKRVVCSGWPSVDGYRDTCHIHSEKT